MSSRRAGAPHHAPPPFQYSLCNEPLIELSNPGASGSLFYVTSDDEFIIKTVMHKEAEFLQKLLPGYYMVGAGAGSRRPWGALSTAPNLTQQFRSAPSCFLWTCRSKGSKAPWTRSQDLGAPPTHWATRRLPGCLSLTLGDPSGDPPYL